ncbi:hypothetical protein KOAAANKH_00085 [Brevundimonas sp. NIBR10]|uniref:hypothetical protein n=1 Tax=Brevundimonas sp. NIBR10 TaxID=3015997 RepID=UPI0022F15EF7|nr:hypothetical protein [Brevundimonas sp. NIBR10]WGM45224.1 hypothetical protein KOAAANKH_00085 [Brevundimonas sp. NIBR10]
MKSLTLAVLFVLTGFDPIAGSIAAVQEWRAIEAYDRCAAGAGALNDWACE